RVLRLLTVQVNDEPGDGLADRVEARWVELVEGVLDSVLVGVRPVDQIDRRDPPRQERNVVVDDRRLGTRREHVPGARLRGGVAQLRPELWSRVRLARDPDSLVGDVVEQDHVPDLTGVSRGVGAGAAEGAVLEVPIRAPRRSLLAIE